MLFYPKIPTIKASSHVAVIQRKSRFFQMNILKHKKEKEKQNENKRQNGGKMQKNWARLGRMTLPKRGGEAAAVG